MTRGRLIVLLILAVLVVARRPDTLLHAQFWAEGGAIWYAEAYNSSGLQTLFRTEGGYFQSLPRLVALAALALPLAAVPLLFNSIALAIQLLPALFLLSDRVTSLGPRRVHVVLAFLYVALPNSHEVHGHLTNSQWHLAVLAILILGAGRAATRSWRIFDRVALVACALTGPFVILLAPLALWTHARNEEPRWMGQTSR